ncbi:MAG: hypothetical protein WBO55_06890, partial [Rhizobiaceae bacterium]
MEIPSNSDADNLFFESIVSTYIKYPRFLRRDWLAAEIDPYLANPACRFVLLTAEPGFGKSVFMAQLAAKHPDWPRYFIRRDQREPLADVGICSFLLRIGYQLLVRFPELFDSDAIRLSVEQRIGIVGDRGTVVGAEIEKLVASPFYTKVVEVKQQIASTTGSAVGLRIGELVIEPHLLDPIDLQHMALIDPARAMQRLHPGLQIVILIDALDEIRYHDSEDNILKWLTNCPELPPNIHFVLSSRPPDDALKVFCQQKASGLRTLVVTPQDSRVQLDVESYARRLAIRPDVAAELVLLDIGNDIFVTQAVDKANGNIGYLDAIERAIDAVLTRFDSVDRTMVRALLELDQLPNELGALYGFFLRRIKNTVRRGKIALTDPKTGETYDKWVWPEVYTPILGVLAVALTPLSLDQIVALGRINAGRTYAVEAMNWLAQFLNIKEGNYRLYHTTVREFLTATATKEQFDDLWVDATDWNRKIAAYYMYNVESYGMSTTSEIANGKKSDSYGLKYLAFHLTAAGDYVALSQLLMSDFVLHKLRMSISGL